MINPELRRYAWLDLGVHRLVIVPLVIAAIAAMLYVANEKPAEPIAAAALGAFAAITLGWGTIRAFASVVEEVREHTWDFQRMAAIRPWTLAWGKLFGAPIFAWYIGAWCLALYVVAGLAAGVRHLASTVVAAVASAVLLHGLSVAGSALGARAAVGGKTRRASGIVVLLMLLYTVPSLLMMGMMADADTRTRIHWWGFSNLHPRTFIALSATLFAGWAAFAAWRTMARELREPGWWWGWPAFAAFTAVWWAGLSSATTPAPTLPAVIGLASAVLVVATYVGLSLDPLTGVSWARFARARSAGVAWDRRVPHWLIHVAIAVVLGLLALVLALAMARDLPGADLALLGPLALIAPPVALMALRDAAVVTCFTLAGRMRRPLPAATFYIAVADLLVPGVFASAGAPALAQAVCPLWALAEHPLYPVAGFAVHVVLAAIALAWCLRRRTAT